MSRAQELRQRLIEHQQALGKNDTAFSALIKGVGRAYWGRLRTEPDLPITLAFCAKIRVAFPRFTGLTLDVERELLGDTVEAEI